jgi:Domain of unknown function (DUF1413)
MMPIIKTVVDEETYAKLVRLRRSEGLPSVSALFLKKAGVFTEEKEASEIVRAAFAQVNRRSKGYEFRLRDLFPRDRWEAFSKAGRLRAGRIFHAEASTARRGVLIGGKTASNHQLYKVA